MKVTLSDRKFIVKLMRIFNLRAVNIGWSNSKKVWPDIWCYPDEVPPRIAVTAEWARQSASERQKRLTHELIHILGYDHNEDLGYSTFPARDTFSKKVYEVIR